MNAYEAVVRELRKYKGLKAFVENAGKQIELIEDDIQGAIGIQYDTIGCKTNNINRTVENEVLDRDERIDMLNNKIRIAQEIIDRIDRSLEILNETERKVVELKYMDNQPWFKISSKVSMSERQCQRMRTEAIKRLITPFFGDK